MYQQDWILRQIEMMVKFIARAVFGKKDLEYRVVDPDFLTDADFLYLRLAELLREGNICGAENLLFESFRENEDYLLLAADFYQQLNEWSDEELEAANFSRQEISEGLGGILRRFGLPETGIS